MPKRNRPIDGNGVIPVKTAEALCKQFGFDGIIILGFDNLENKIETATYGRTQPLCQYFAYIRDRIVSWFWESKQILEDECPLNPKNK